MPIYIESKGIGFNSNTLARHEYLVYVPDGQELNYDAWKTIGAYPTGGPNDLDGFGSGTLLDAEFVDSFLSALESKDKWTTGDFPIVSGLFTVQELVAAGLGGIAAGNRARELVYEGTDEAVIWSELSSIALSLDDQFTYKVIDLFGVSNDVVFGPTLNSNSFITSILRLASLDGINIQAFETDLNEPGNETWLGDATDNVMDANTVFASGDQVDALFGGQGSDLLIGTDFGTSSSPFYLVGGDDYDVDTLEGGDGTDYLVGYFNQADAASSDVFLAGGGDDWIIIIDPVFAAAGGLPDLSFELDGSSASFIGSPGPGGTLSGGEGFDILDFRNLNGSVVFDAGVVGVDSIEGIAGSRFDDTISSGDPDTLIEGFGGDDQISGGLGSDQLRGMEGDDVINRGAEGGSGAPDRIEGGSGDDAITIEAGVAYGQANDDTILLTGNSVAATVEAYGGSGNDVLDATGAVGANTLSGGSGDDVLHGNGKSTLTGGSGVDIFYITAGDTITDAEAYDRIFFDGVELTEDADILMAMEIGTSGDHGLIPYFRAGQTLGNTSGETLTSDIAIAWVPRGLADDFDGTVTSIEYDLLIFTNVSVDGRSGLGLPPASGRLNPADAVAVIEGVRQGDFGLFPNGFQAGLGGSNLLHNSTAVSLDYDGIDYGWGGTLGNGTGQLFDQEALDAETQFETLTETLSDESQLTDDGDGNLTGGPDGDYLIGSGGAASGGDGDDWIILAELDDTASGDAGNDLIVGAGGNDFLEGGDGNDQLFGGNAPGSGLFSPPQSGNGENDTLLAGGGDDLAYGGDGDDLIGGGDGADRLFGELGDDSVLGGAGADEIDGGEGNDTLAGDDGNDTVQGGNGVDDVSGGLGDDSLYGGAGNDAIDGGDGRDRISGGEGHDDMSGGTGADSIRGGSGDDTIRGGEGDDLLFGNVGDDIYLYRFGDGSDTIFDTGPYAYQDTDSLVLEDINSTEVSYFQDGDHLWLAFSNGDVLKVHKQYKPGNAGVEEAVFADNVTVDLKTVATLTAIRGTANADTLQGNANADLIFGWAGNDSIDGMDGNDTLRGGDGDDTLSGGAGDDFLVPGDGADVIVFGDGADQAFGFDIVEDGIAIGSTILDPNAPLSGFSISQIGADTIIDDGAGNSLTLVGIDLAEWLAAQFSVVTVDGTSGSDVINDTFTDANGDVIDDSGQIIVGYSGNDRLYGGDGDDTTFGGDGTDKLYGSLGGDHLDGGDGNDFVIYDTSTAGITIDMLNSANSTGEAAGDTYESVEKLQGSSFDDIIFLADGIYGYGLDGNDTIHDGGARESLIGGNGQDVFVFGAGDGQRDQINDFTRGDDLIDLRAWGVSDFSQLTITTQTTNDPNEVHVTITFGGESIRLFKFDAAEVANLSAADFVLASAPATAPDLYGTASADVIDSSFVDANGNTLSPMGQVIYAGAGNDVIKDSDGDDTVYGEDGRDTFYAGDGADFYDGGADKDTVRYREIGSGLTIDMNNSANSTGVAAGDTFANIEKIQGTNYDDVIFLAAGVSGEGWGGNDVIYDSTGAESMNGGAGADTFVFVAGDGFRDQITGFEEGIDLIDISAWGASEFGDLTITTRVLSNGTQANVDISYNGDTLRLHKLSLADVANIDASDFILA